MGPGPTTRTERTRRSILGAAEEQFLAHGFLGASMDEIAAAAQVSKQTVYAHFQSKEALFLQVVGDMTGGAAAQHREQVADPAGYEPIEAFLLEFAIRQLQIVMTPRLMRLRRLVIGEAERFPELGRALHKNGPQRAIDRLSSAFRAYAEGRVLATNDPASAAAFFNWLLMGGPVNDAMLLGDEAIPDAQTFEAHAREAVRIFLAAYGSGGPS